MHFGNEVGWLRWPAVDGCPKTPKYTQQTRVQWNHFVLYGQVRYEFGRIVDVDVNRALHPVPSPSDHLFIRVFYVAPDPADFKWINNGSSIKSTYILNYHRFFFFVIRFISGRTFKVAPNVVLQLWAAQPDIPATARPAHNKPLPVSPWQFVGNPSRKNVLNHIKARELFSMVWAVLYTHRQPPSSQPYLSLFREHGAMECGPVQQQCGPQKAP